MTAAADILTFTFGCARGCYRTIPVTLDATPYDRCPVCAAPWVRDPPPNPRAAPRLTAAADAAPAATQHDGGFWQ